MEKHELDRMNCCELLNSEDSVILSTQCDLENQRVIRADAERTRGSENLNKDKVEVLLTLYCKRNNLKYKQGLNEVRISHCVYKMIGFSSFCLHPSSVLVAFDLCLQLHVDIHR